MGWSITIKSCSWIDFISVAYARWYHWTCGQTQRKAATINQLACPSYSLYVQLLWYPMYYPGGMKARVSPVQWSKPHSILPPLRIRTRAAGFRIISGIHYTTTAHIICDPDSNAHWKFRNQPKKWDRASPLKQKLNHKLKINCQHLSKAAKPG